MTMDEALTPPKSVAIVGLSTDPARPSYQVAQYLLAHGYKIIPVNPNIQDFMGIHAYDSFSAIPREFPVDVVDIFRKSEEVPALMLEIVHTGRTPFVWMQEGVFSEVAKKLAEDHGLGVVMNTCMMKSHKAKG